MAKRKKRNRFAKKITYSKKYTNQVTLHFTAQKLESKLIQVNHLYHSIKYRYYKGTVTNLLLFFKIGYSETTRQRYRERYDMELPEYFWKGFMWDRRIDPRGPADILNWVKEKIKEYYDTSEDILKNNPDYNLRDVYNLKELSLRFFYAEDMPDLPEPDYLNN